MNTITEEHITRLLDQAAIQTQRMGRKTLVMVVTLPSGFEITESAACVDPQNFSAEIGHSICLERVRNRMWELEGYRLQQQLAEELDKDRNHG